MGKKRESPARNTKTNSDRWQFFDGIKALLSAFPHATTGQQAAIVAMSLGAVMFIGLGLVGSVALPAWAVVMMFVIGTLLIFATAAMLLVMERHVIVPARCRHVPVYPLKDTTRTTIKPALEEIRSDVAAHLRNKHPNVKDDDIRANIFLLAEIDGGPADGTWKLVIHPDFAINMNHPAERQLQLCVGQGATGMAYRDGTYQLTRRLAAPKGEWDQKFQMTPELSAQIHKRLKWIISFPLLIPHTSEAIGVVNVDGLTDVPEDDLLNTAASSVRNKIEAIAHIISFEHLSCIGIDKLGVMENV